MSDLQRIMPNSDAPPCPGWLVGPLASHRDRHGPHYQGFLSDHLPMALLAWFDAEITARGTQATLDSYLPGLISGWARFAFHPIIRLGVCAVERHASGVPKA